MIVNFVQNILNGDLFNSLKEVLASHGLNYDFLPYLVIGLYGFVIVMVLYGIIKGILALFKLRR